MIENKIYCNKCGTANRIDSKFCSKCGVILNNAEYQICPHCNFQLPINAKRCTHCGKMINQSEDHEIVIILGYICSVLFSLVGLVFAIYLITRDDEKAKKHGLIQLVISIVLLFIGVIVASFGLMFTSFYY